MNARTMSAVAVFTLIGTGVFVAQDDFVPGIGEQVTFTLRDCDAANYFRKQLTPIPDEPVGNDRIFGFQSIATITNVHSDGQFEIEHTSAVSSRDGVTRMVTMTATAGRFDETTPITVRLSPVGTLVYSSPADKYPKATRKETTTVEVDLSKAKINLRTWILADEMKFNQ